VTNVADLVVGNTQRSGGAAGSRGKEGSVGNAEINDPRRLGPRRVEGEERIIGRQREADWVNGGDGGARGSDRTEGPGNGRGRTPAEKENAPAAGPSRQLPLHLLRRPGHAPGCQRLLLSPCL
jgi:hypothetical protein